MLSATRWSYFILHKSLFCKNSTKISMSSLIFVYGDHFNNKLRLGILFVILIQRLIAKTVNFLFTLMTPSNIAKNNDILCIVNRLYYNMVATEWFWDSGWHSNILSQKTNKLSVEIKAKKSFLSRLFFRQIYLFFQ